VEKTKKKSGKWRIGGDDEEAAYQMSASIVGQQSSDVK